MLVVLYDFVATFCPKEVTICKYGSYWEVNIWIAEAVLKMQWMHKEVWILEDFELNSLYTALLICQVTL